MAELLKTTVAGETARHFMQLILMQQQQTLFALGKHPNPQPPVPKPNRNLARACNDQLLAVRERTRGNLIREESELLGRVIERLELLYAETFQNE